MSNVKSRMKRPAILIAAAVVFGFALYAAYRVGLDGGLARSTYVQTVALREERKCLVAADLSCLRASWELRAGIASGGARHGVETPFPTGVSEGLGAYLRWYESERKSGSGK